MIPEPSGTTALISNPEYVSLFSRLGWASTTVGILLVLLIPFLRRLITDKAIETAATPLAVVPAR
jgi:POT family proton-dependent oligopeptide transporter